MTYHIDIDSHFIYAEKISLQQSDDAPLIIFLHDAWGCVALWGDFPEKLAAQTGCNALLYDRRGFGQSGADESGERTPEYFYDEAQSLITLVDVLHVKKVILFGHSDGATIALLAAALYPERVEALMVESPHTFLEESGLEAVFKTAQKTQNTGLIQALKKYHGKKAQSLFRKWKNCWTSAAFAGWSVLPKLSTIECPVLAFRGVNDIFDTNEQLYQLQDYIQSNIEIKIIPNAAHSPHKEAKDETLKICLEWVKKHTLK
ncbi:MAG: alpha/beta hydrolase [Paludibacteraceae bacterium]|nr:alpha/beta hydrolase [Paludibacteraceae bacterium]